MEAIGEIIAAIFLGLTELTVQLALLAIHPIRYLVSRGYRRRVQEQWRGHGGRIPASFSSLPDRI